MPGSGKTTVGRKLATFFSIPFFDLDQLISESYGDTIATIFNKEGEPYFRMLERDILQEFVIKKPRFILSTGGGTPCFFDNINLMNKVGVTLLVDTPLKSIKQRLQQDTIRPLLQTNTLETLWEERKIYYQQAQLQVSTEQKICEAVQGVAE